jgi:hypothetical protein
MFSRYNSFEIQKKLQDSWFVRISTISSQKPCMVSKIESPTVSQLKCRAGLDENCTLLKETQQEIPNNRLENYNNINFSQNCLVFILLGSVSHPMK